MDEQWAVKRAPPLQKYTLQPYYSIAGTILRPYFRSGHEMQCSYTWSHDSIHNMMIRLGFCVPFATFFYSLRSKSRRILFALYYMFRYIRQHHLFTSFASYSLQNIRTNLHANIHFLVLANICFKIFL